MRRVRRLEAGLRIADIRNSVRLHLQGPPGNVIVVDQLVDAVVDEVRIAEVFRPIREDALLHLGNEVDVLRRVVRHALEEVREVVFHLQQLDQGKTTRARWRCRHDLEIAPVRTQRLAPDRFVLFEIVCRHQAVAARHLLDEQSGRFAAVKIVRTLIGDAPQRRRQFRLPETMPHLHEAELRKKIRLDIEPVALFFHIGNELLVRQEALLGQRDGGHHQVFPRQRTVALMRGPESGDRARDTGRLAADHGRILGHIAVRIEVHVAVGRERRLLPVVEKLFTTVLVDQHEAAATDIAGDGVRNGE